jgi:hypothetical protein
MTPGVKWAVAIGAAALAACGPAGSDRRSDGRSALQVRWTAELHVPRGAVQVERMGMDASGNVYVLWLQTGPPETGLVLHLQKRGPDGALLWDQTSPWFTPADFTGMAVTPLGNVLLALYAGAPALVGGEVVPAGDTLVKVGPDGHLVWHTPLSTSAGGLVTDANGSALLASSSFVGPASIFQGRSVAKYGFDGALAWDAPFPIPVYAPSVAPDGGGGMFVATNDTTGGDGSGGLLVHRDASGTATWQQVFEHFRTYQLAPAAGGGVYLLGQAATRARYAGAPLQGEDSKLLGIGSDGGLRWMRSVDSGIAAVAPGGGTLLLAGGFSVDVTRLTAVRADGTTSWQAELAASVGLAALGDAGDLALALRPLGVFDPPLRFTVAGTPVSVTDTSSVVLVGLGPKPAVP